MTEAREPRTMRIPRQRAPENIIRARERRSGDASPCIVCGLPVTKPVYYCHVVAGGSRALHAEDEALYVSDGGDMSHLPVGTDCLRRNPELKPFATKA